MSQPEAQRIRTERALQGPCPLIIPTQWFFDSLPHPPGCMTVNKIIYGLCPNPLGNKIPQAPENAFGHFRQ